jgi:hypothetical protein
MSRPLELSRTLAPVLLATVVLFLTAAGCSNSPDQTAEASAAGFAEELKEADRLFAKEVSAAPATDRGRVWADWFSSGGRQIIPGQVVQGPPSIADLMGPAFATGDMMLTWAPDLASASKDGDLGWTSGRYEISGGNDDSAKTGRYLTIWGRQVDGTWKVDLDTGVPDPGQ